MQDNSLQRHTFWLACAMLLAFGLLTCSSYAEDNANTMPALQLQYRTLGNTDMRVTAVSMDCMYSKEELITAASEAGINWFDTAWFFGRGRSEWATGRALKNKRDKVFICTRIPLGTKDKMLDYLDMSLTRLQTDHVDMLMLHGTRKREDVLDPDALAALQEAKNSGKARFIGVSIQGQPVQSLDAAVDAGVYDAVQTVYYKGIQQEVRDAVARAHKSGLPVIAMHVQPPRRKKSSEDIPSIQSAIKWVLNDPNITFVVAETLSHEQLRSNITALYMIAPVQEMQ